MRVILVLSFFVVATVATSAASLSLEEAVITKTDCQNCLETIFSTIIGCSMWGSSDWIGCAEEVLGPDHPCTPCICELIVDICLDLGCNLSC